jgi:hypothetical protein
MDAPIDLRSIYKPTPFTGEGSIYLDDLERSLAWHGMNMSPPYQRGHVWTREQQEAFMGHLLSGGEILPIVVQREPDSEYAELLDGKQRITAMLAWVRGEIDALLLDGRKINISHLEKHDRGGRKDRVVGLSRIEIRVKYINLPFEERKRFYVRLNSAGTPHTREELEAALKATEKV